MTEQQPYTVINKIGSIEIRDYPASVYAQLTRSGDPNQVGSKAFGSLIGYISRNKIAMTAPVIQERNAAQWNVSFVMPAGLKAEELPEPWLPGNWGTAVGAVRPTLEAVVHARQ